MSTSELKEKLKGQINDTNNDDLLSEISSMLYVESKSVDGIYQMSKAEIEAVEDGLNQMKKRQSLSHEEVKKQTAEWLRE